MNTPTNWAERLTEAVREAGLESLPDGASAQFAAYLELLLKWNSRLNLTAIRNPEEILRRHFLESIECALALPAVAELPAATVLDLGSGAGFPGIPVAILRPEITVTLAESQAKKSSFLREVVRTLGLNARVHDGRIETMPEAQYFGAVTLRAVDKMVEATSLAAKRVASGGYLVLFATETTQAAVKEAVSAVQPGLIWLENLPIRSSGHGFLLKGHLPA
ncbi:16S rRNA (guanine(527)-N(7))-methyltransferase RsmG [Silvibacterium sp.]|uniref:16S rRNA (guanine(527)-N(7))-methyltransferase RsmG n=1 Tax=Silvibacterium sp. TaxID=1964179 RepID=UPI0039E48EF3